MMIDSSPTTALGLGSDSRMAAIHYLCTWDIQAACQVLSDSGNRIQEQHTFQRILTNFFFKNCKISKMVLGKMNNHLGK